MFLIDWMIDSIFLILYFISTVFSVSSSPPQGWILEQDWLESLGWMPWGVAWGWQTWLAWVAWVGWPGWVALGEWALATPWHRPTMEFNNIMVSTGQRFRKYHICCTASEAAVHIFTQDKSRFAWLYTFATNWVWNREVCSTIVTGFSLGLNDRAQHPVVLVSALSFFQRPVIFWEPFGFFGLSSALF